MMNTKKTILLIFFGLLFKFSGAQTDLAIIKLVSPLTTGCNHTSTPVALRIKNTGTGSIDFNFQHAVFSGTVSGAISQSFSDSLYNNVLNGGNPLAPNDSVVVTIGNIDMTLEGTYNFNLTVTIPNDGHAGNNTLDQEVVVSWGRVLADTIRICNGNRTLLRLAGNNGTIQWQSFNGSTWMNETGTGANTNEYEVTPVVSTLYRALVCDSAHAFDSTQVNLITLLPLNVTGDTICAGSSASLSAEGNNLVWYEQSMGGTVLDSGNSFITPPVDSATTYYVRETSAPAAQPLQTIFEWSYSAMGNYFDIKAINTIKITGFDVSPNAAPAHFKIYYRHGSYTMNGSNSNGWIFLDSGIVMTAGYGVPIPTNFSLTIPADSTYGFYIFHEGWMKTTSTKRLFSDGNIEIKEGHSGNASFQAISAPRVFNGRIHYDLVGEGPAVPVVADVFPPVPVDLGSDTILCTTCSWQLDAGAGYIEYKWQDGSTAQVFSIPAGTTTETYYVTVTDTNGCVGSDTITISRNVGIAESNADNNISIKPNPSSGIFNIDYKGTELKDAVIEIRNVEGQLIYHDKQKKLTNGYQQQISLDSFAKGIYILTIDAQEQTIINKLVIQ
jgi:hypothetical protein